ncbi:hypothetical protein CR513_13317, partial [Mucuna pruriens]
MVGASHRLAFKSMGLIDVTMSSKQLATLYDSIFDKFDDNRSNAFGGCEFREEMKKILLASVDQLKSFSIQVVLEDDPNSLLQKATSNIKTLRGDPKTLRGINEDLERDGPLTSQTINEDFERGSLKTPSINEDPERGGSLTPRQ